MNVEEQHITILRREALQVFGLWQWIAVTCFAVGDVDDDGREATVMILEPILKDSASFVQTLAHGRSAVDHRFEPDREFYFLIHQASSAVIDLLGALVDRSGTVGNFAQRNKSPIGEWATKSRSYLI